MFIGHYAVALAAKKAAPTVSLGTLFIAAQFLDLLWPLLLLLGIEHVNIDPGNTKFTPLDFYNYPFSHSLIGTLLWGILAGLVYILVKKATASGRNTDTKILLKNGMLIGLVVISHWVLDLITHLPDLPLSFDNSSLHGFGLWNSVAGTLILEISLFAIGILIYLKATDAKDKTGIYAFWALIAILSMIYIMNVFGSAPPDSKSIAIVGNASWLFVIWAYWVDKHRNNMYITKYTK